jgi:hypothetical protein
MKKAGLLIFSLILLIGFVYAINENAGNSESGNPQNIENESGNDDTGNTNCKFLYWFDSEKKSCGYKKFCGLYMYEGLETFDNFNDCNAAIPANQRKVNSTKFIPWQKRNTSECPNGCECHGAVVSCKTEDGKIMTIEAGNSGNVITITVDKTEANTTLEIETENDTEINGNTKLFTNLSNGRKAEIKIMPDVAIQKAIERLGELNWTIELKEVGSGNEKKLAYELAGEKQGRFLGIFKIKAKILARVNAETGKVDYTKKPWWAFLASGI